MPPGLNPLVLAVGALQFCGGLYAFWHADWKMGVINVCVGVANATLATMAKA